MFVPVKESLKYKLVRVASGVQSVHSLAHGETFHPVVGPAAEAAALYVRQVDLRRRLREEKGEFVIWDVGLGAGANPVSVLRAAGDFNCSIRLVSFDHTTGPMRFALQHAAELEFL